MPGKQVWQQRSFAATCLGMSCLRAEVDHGLGDFLVLQNLGHRCDLYSSPEPGKSMCLISKEISVWCV